MKLALHSGVLFLFVVGAYANCGITTKTGNGPDTLKYSYSTASLESCTWTLTPIYDSPVPTYPDQKTMLIMTITEWSSSLDTSSLTLMPNIKFTKNDLGNCYRFVQSLNTECQDAHFKDECPTAIVRLSSSALLKYKLTSVGFGLKFSVSYQFVKCEEQPTTTTTTVKPTTTTTAIKKPETDSNEDTNSGSDSQTLGLSMLHVGLIVGGLLLIVIGLVMYIVIKRKPKRVVYQDGNSGY